MLNKIILIGRLTRDPELRYTGSGVPVAKFPLAVDRPFKKKDGEKETDFIDVVTWRTLAENCANHLGKGRLVAVEGRLQIRSYDDNQGIRRKAAEVMADNVRYLDRAKDPATGLSMDDVPEIPFKDPKADKYIENNGFGAEIKFDDDDLPF